MNLKTIIYIYIISVKRDGEHIYFVNPAVSVSNIIIR